MSRMAGYYLLLTATERDADLRCLTTNVAQVLDDDAVAGKE